MYPIQTVPVFFFGRNSSCSNNAMAHSKLSSTHVHICASIYVHGYTNTLHGSLLTRTSVIRGASSAVRWIDRSVTRSGAGSAAYCGRGRRRRPTTAPRRARATPPSPPPPAPAAPRARAARRRRRRRRPARRRTPPPS